MNSVKAKKGYILIAGLAVVLFVIAGTGWSYYRLSDIKLCTVCHEISVQNEDYQPVIPEGEFPKGSLVSNPGKSRPGLFKVNIGCADCHMYPYEEYKKSAHYKNEKGMKPGCVGCHEPHSAWQITRWKFLYVNKGGYGESPFHAISNSIRDLPEWEGLRKEWAKRVREEMFKEKDFRCNKCHNPSGDWFPKKKAHKKAIEKNKTCIECHYNLVHAEVPWPEMEEKK
ncbi:MAG: NapC/NirT family cytochrome c [Deltaproteobacteria bacterium]|nr:NapC/NirT family cytochrome c [Deltaproteobacteria bacterium]